MKRKDLDVSTSQLSKDKLNTLIEIVTLNLRTDDEVDERIDIVCRFRQVTGILRGGREGSFSEGGSEGVTSGYSHGESHGAIGNETCEKVIAVCEHSFKSFDANTRCCL